MDFVIGLSILANWKGVSYDFILVIVNQLTKMVYYKPIKIIIDVSELVEVIINIVVRHYSLPDLILTNKNAFFILKFWSFLCYFLNIK